MLEDWDTWGNWVEQPDGTAKRVRICRNKGPNAKCRGKSVQIRKRIKILEDEETEVPEDWEPWAEWTQVSDGVWTRKRVCKNKGQGAKCRGSSLQRKTRKITYIYVIEFDPGSTFLD